MKSISVDDLFNSGKISRKTYNTLVRARMRNLFDLKRYESGLPRLFRSGANGMREINVLLRDLATADSMPEMASMLFAIPEPEMSKGEQLLSSLSDDELSLLGIVYRRQIDKLLHSHERASTKVANALSGVPVNIFVRDFLYEDDERLLMLNEVSENSLAQVGCVRDALITEIEKIKDTEMSVPYRILTLQSDGLLDDDGFARAYFEEHQHLPIFYVIQKAILAKRTDTVMLAFLQRYDIFGGQVEIDSAKIDKSAFTITTYSNQVYDALFTPGAPAQVLGGFVAELMANDVNVAYLDEKVARQLIMEDSELIANLITEEHLVLSPLSITVILGKLLAHTQAGFGGFPRSFGMAMDERWKHAYVIDKTLADILDFQKQLWLFRDNVVRASVDNYLFDFDDYMSQMPDIEHPDFQVHKAELTDVLKTMVVRELDLKLDEGGLLMIPRMRDKPLSDRLYDILDKKKQPMMLDELTEQINSGDGRRYVRASVSLALNRDERFQGSGKKGCYALSVWQLPYFGSNSEIVYQVLDEANRPMRSDEIVAIIAAHPYNSQFSKNDLSSVISLGKKMFRKLGLGYYGLTDREYAQEDIQPPKRAFEVELEAMHLFLDRHHRVPASSSNEDENRLRIWFARKYKDWTGENNWSESKRAAFAQLVEKYNALVNVGQPLSLNLDNPVEPAAQPEAVCQSESIEVGLTEDIVSEPIAAFVPEPVSEPASEPMAVPAVSDSESVAESDSEPASETDVEAAPSVEPESQAVSAAPESPIASSVEHQDEEWSIMAEEVRCFVEQNGREPLALFTAEVMLADWLTEQKRRMHEQMLTEKQVALLLALRDRLW